MREQSRSFADAGRRKSPEAVPRQNGQDRKRNRIRSPLCRRSRRRNAVIQTIAGSRARSGNWRPCFRSGCDRAVGEEPNAVAIPPGDYHMGAESVRGPTHECLDPRHLGVTEIVQLRKLDDPTPRVCIAASLLPRSASSSAKYSPATFRSSADLATTHLGRFEKIAQGVGDMNR